MQQNAYLLAKIGADAAENERNFAEVLRHVQAFLDKLENVIFKLIGKLHISPGGLGAEAVWCTTSTQRN